GDNLYHAHFIPSHPHRVCEFVGLPFHSTRYLNHALRAPLNQDGSGPEPKFPEHRVNLVRKDRYKILTFHTKDLPAKISCLRQFLIVESLDEKGVVGMGPTKKLKPCLRWLIQDVFVPDPYEYPCDNRSRIHVGKLQGLRQQLTGDLCGRKHRRTQSMDAVALFKRLLIA